MKSLIPILLIALASCHSSTESAQESTPHVIDSVIYVKQLSGMPPTFTRVYWKFYADGYWSVSHKPVHKGDTVFIAHPR